MNCILNCYSIMKSFHCYMNICSKFVLLHWQGMQRSYVNIANTCKPKACVLYSPDCCVPWSILSVIYQRLLSLQPPPKLSLSTTRTPEERFRKLSLMKHKWSEFSMAVSIRWAHWMVLKKSIITLHFIVVFVKKILFFPIL